MEHPNKSSQCRFGLTQQILIAMVLGIAVGLLIHYLPTSLWLEEIIVEDLFSLGGEIFITFMKMLVVPIVFVSLVCGVCNLDNSRRLGLMGLKTLLLYLITTSLAITLGITVASILTIGQGSDLQAMQAFSSQQIPSFKQTIVDMFPDNPFTAFASGNMLQIIVFALLLGTAISFSGRPGKRIASLFDDFNAVVMRLTTMIIHVAPIGVFCLIATLFAREGIALIQQLAAYFFVVLLVLLIHLVVSNTLLVKILARLNPLVFFRKMYSAMLFAFSVSSSNVSIPVVLETVEFKLGVRNSIASFVIPLGATINMDGTAIMQGVATVFIANAYNIDIGLTGYLLVIVTATLASIGTAGVPSVGLITLAMVLKQVGLPVEGIGLIIGVDRLLDMVRTAVNITGDAAVACVVAKSENALDENVFYDPKTSL